MAEVLFPGLCPLRYVVLKASL